MNPEHDKPPADAASTGLPAPPDNQLAENGLPDNGHEAAPLGMADQITANVPPGPADQIAAGSPADTSTQVAAGPPPAVARPRVDHAAPAPQAEALLVLRQLLGLVILGAAGWGFIALVAHLANTWKIGISWEAAAIVAAILSFGLFLLLEQNLWLSRFMGLRLSPRATPLKEALFFWLTGVVGLMLRTTVAPEDLPTGAPAQAAGDRPLEPEVKDGFREIVETVVFVVVLVLMLKGFLAEAFVIPTGSMATTLLGYHQDVTCPQCGFRFRINMSTQLDAEQPHHAFVTGCTCPNCFLPFELRNNFPQGNQP